MMQAAGHEMSARNKQIKNDGIQPHAHLHPKSPRHSAGQIASIVRPKSGRLTPEQCCKTTVLDLANFKGITGCSTASDIIGHEIAHAGFIFYSPKIAQNITVEIELLKGGGIKQWQISRLSNIAALMDQLEPDYRTRPA